MPSVRDSNYDVEEIAFHRTIAVTIGTLWGLFVTRYVFPFEARKELRDGISEWVIPQASLGYRLSALDDRLLLNMGFFYQKVVERVSLGDEAYHGQLLADSEATLAYSHERTPLLKQGFEIDSSKAFVDMEMHLQISLIHVRCETAASLT